MENSSATPTVLIPPVPPIRLPMFYEEGPGKDFVEGAFSFPPAPDKSDNAEIWRTYVTKADEHDAALLKRWNEGIDVFLLFTGLFSAILSAFLIASWSTLQPDSAQATVDGLVAISQQLTALSVGQPLNSSAEYQPQPFVAPWWAVAVNGLWFTSLMLSLIAAVSAMLVKEWLSAYNENAAPLPIERVEQRQFRYDGLIKWSLPTIVSFLPLSIHIAVFLFFIGLAIFTWSVSAALCALTSCLLCTSFGLYVASASAPLFFLECPYKSPLSTVLGLIHRQARVLIQHVLRACLPKRYFSGDVDIGGTYRSSAPRNSSRQALAPVTLQAKAIAWLCKSADRNVQEAALYFLARWRAPQVAWEAIHQDVEKASVGFVITGYLLSSNAVPDADEAAQNLALISCLFPARAAGGGLLGDMMRAFDALSPPYPYLYFQKVGPRHRLIRLNCKGVDSVLQHSNRTWEFPRTLEGVQILAEALHRHALYFPTNWEALILSQPFAFVFRGFCRAKVPRTCLFQYLCLLGHALSLDGLECCSETDSWTARYPISPNTTGSLLVSCAESLERALEPESVRSATPTPVMRLRASGFPLAARSIQKALLLCAARNPEMLTGYELAALIRVLGKMLFLFPKTAALEDSEASWAVTFGTRAETISLIVDFFRAVGINNIVNYCLWHGLKCLRYLVAVQADPQVFIDVLEGPTHGVDDTPTVESFPSWGFVQDGHLKDLLDLIEEKTSPLILLAVYVARGALVGLHPAAGRPSRKLSALRHLISDGWLDCMWEYGMDYLFICHRKYNNKESTEWLRAFKYCMQELIQGNCEVAKASALLERFKEEMKELSVGSEMTKGSIHSINIKSHAG